MPDPRSEVSLSIRQALLLDVREKILDALRFYRRFGFDIFGTRSFEVATGDDRFMARLRCSAETE